MFRFANLRSALVLTLVVPAAAAASQTPEPTAVAASQWCRPDDYSGHPPGELVTYLLDETSSSNDTRASSILRNGNIEWRIELKGYLFNPKNLGAPHSRPVLVYNHGHDSTQPPCAVVKYFRDKGFIVFAPLRRGQGAPSNPDHSTGINIETYTQNCPVCITQAQFDARELNYVKTQSRDIATAVDWIGNRQHADPKKITLMGHSYGGIAVIFANELAPNPPHHHKTVIDVSGAELSWDSNSIMRLELPPAVTRGRKPIFILQPENGVSVGPTLAFMPAAASVGLDYWAHIYPPVPNSTASEAHGRFILEDNQVAKWAPDVLSFLEQRGAR